MLGGSCSPCCGQCNQLRLAQRVEVDISAADHVHNCVNQFNVQGWGFAGSVMNGTWSLTRTETTDVSSTWSTSFGGAVCGKFKYDLTVVLGVYETDALSLRLSGEILWSIYFKQGNSSFLFDSIASLCNTDYVENLGYGYQGMSLNASCEDFSAGFPDVNFTRIRNLSDSTYISGFPACRTFSYNTCSAVDFGSPQIGVTAVRVYF